MVIKQATISQETIYTPEWNENKSLPVGEQITVKHKAVSVSLKEKLFPRAFDIRQEKVDSKDMLASMTVPIDRKKVISEMTIEISGLEYEVEDGRTKRIRTAEDLFGAPIAFDSLAEELYSYYQLLFNQKADEKN